MLTLAAMLYLIIAPTLAGTLVLIGLLMPELGYVTLEGVGALAGAGAAAAAPMALILAWSLRRRRRSV